MEFPINCTSEEIAECTYASPDKKFKLYKLVTHLLAFDKAEEGQKDCVLNKWH